MDEKDLQKYYKTLDVTPDTPWEDIKRAYHDLMKVWHPDRFAGDPRLQKIVEEKTKELTHAFQKIEEDYHSIKFYHDPLDEEAPPKAKAKPQTEPPAEREKQKPPPRYARRQEAQEWLKKAKAVDTGNYHVIIDLLNKAIDLDPSLEEAYIERGEAYAMLGNHGQAMEDFNDAIELNPKSFGGFRGRANACSELDNHSQAIIDFTSALELEPVNYPELYYLRGKSHEKLGNRDEAKEDFKNAKVLRILSSHSHGADSLSELDDEWKIEERQKVSFKQAGLYVMAIICVAFGILALTFPIILSRDKVKIEPKKELTKGIAVPASPFNLLEKSVSVPAPLPISDYEKASGFGTYKSRGDTRPGRPVEEAGLPPAPQREKTIRERTPEIAPGEKTIPAVQKKRERIRKEIKEQGKKGETRDSFRGKTALDAEKERELEAKKAQQFEKLKKLEKEFPFEMIKER
jgi:tetratricopeptide (TPR) repeat protein